MSVSSTGGRLARIAAELTSYGLHVDGPGDGEPLPGNPDTGYIAIRNPGTGQYAEISLDNSASSNRAGAFLQLSYWTIPAEDPDGMRMAAGVARLLGASPGQALIALDDPGLLLALDAVRLPGSAGDLALESAPQRPAGDGGAPAGLVRGREPQ